MNDVFEIKNWVSADEIDQLVQIVQTWTPVEFCPDYGRWPGQLIARQHWHVWNDQDDLARLLKPRMNQVLGNNLKIVEVDYVELYLPWDIHSEAERPEKGSAPWYTFIIPFENYNSRTMVFDQGSFEFNDFYKYKNISERLENPVDLDFWRQNLSHCWDEDREYLSLQHVSQPWTAGTAVFFKRNFFHASDNFHTRDIGPKKFLQILTDLA